MNTSTAQPLKHKWIWFNTSLHSDTSANINDELNKKKPSISSNTYSTNRSIEWNTTFIPYNHHEHVVPNICINNFGSRGACRCLHEDKMFPRTNPQFCEEKYPHYESKCCNSDFCNKFIRSAILERGEIQVNQQNHRCPNKESLYWQMLSTVRSTILFSGIHQIEQHTYCKTKLANSFQTLYHQPCLSLKTIQIYLSISACSYVPHSDILIAWI